IQRLPRLLAGIGKASSPPCYTCWPSPWLLSIRRFRTVFISWWRFSGLSPTRASNGCWLNQNSIQILTSDEMNPYHGLVAQYARLANESRLYSKGAFAPLPPTDIVADAGCALFFAPHPDDETIIGGLALRLMREARMKVMNVAVTQGSKK